MKSYTKILLEEFLTAKVGENVNIDLEPVVDSQGNHLWKMSPMSEALKKQVQLVDESMRAERANVQRFSFKVLAPGKATIEFHIPRAEVTHPEQEVTCSAKLVIDAR